MKLHSQHRLIGLRVKHPKHPLDSLFFVSQGSPTPKTPSSFWSLSPTSAAARTEEAQNALFALIPGPHARTHTSGEQTQRPNRRANTRFGILIRFYLSFERHWAFRCTWAYIEKKRVEHCGGTQLVKSEPNRKKKCLKTYTISRIRINPTVRLDSLFH